MATKNNPRIAKRLMKKQLEKKKKSKKRSRYFCHYCVGLGIPLRSFFWV
jgi:undecaprenyl pyrophosphate synthase